MNGQHDASTPLNVGVMFSFRNPARWPRPFTDVYRDELQLAGACEDLGYDTVWLTEHHFTPDGYSPSVLTLAAAVAARTSRIRIGFNLLLLPLHNAVRLAEDIAALDILSGGRIDVGVGQGYAPHEFAGFGIPLHERLGRFREGLDVLEGLWTNDTFSYDGTHYRITDAHLSPRPVQQPMPPLWIGATSKPGIRRAGRRGAHLLGVTARAQAIYDAALTEAGHDLETAQTVQLHWMHTAATDDHAWTEAAAHHHHLLTVYTGWLRDAGTEVAVPAETDLRHARPVLFDPAFGSPATVTTKLQRALDQARTTHLALGTLPGMDPSLTRASLERFAHEVRPHLHQ